MKIEQIDRRVEDLGADNQVHVKYRLQFFDEKNDVIENKPVQVFDGDELVFDADTNAEGVAEIEVIADIMEETSKQVTFVVDGERSRDKVLLFEFAPRQKADREKAIARVTEQEKKVNMARVTRCDRFFQDLGIGIVNEDGKEVLINEKGELLGSNRFDEIADFQGLPFSIARIGLKYFLIGTKAELLSDWHDEIVPDLGKKISKVRRGNKYALMDFTGKIVLDWCDEILPATIKDALAVKRGEEYFLYSRLDNGQFAPRCKNGEKFFPFMNGFMKTFNNGRAFAINSEFKFCEFYTFDQYLDRLRKTKELTAEECEKLQSLARSYESAVKGAKALHPEGEVPTFDHVELELAQLSAAELKNICNHIQKPVLVIEPARSFEENLAAMKAPVSFTNRDGEIENKSIANITFFDYSDTCHPIRTKKTTIHVAEGVTKLESVSFEYRRLNFSAGERQITNMKIGVYQSLLMSLMIELKEQIALSGIIDYAPTSNDAKASLDSGDIGENVFFAHVATVATEKYGIYFTAISLPLPLPNRGRFLDRKHCARISMQLFEFDPEEVPFVFLVTPIAAKA